MKKNKGSVRDGEMVGGLYQCTSCGKTAPITDVRQLWVLGATRIDDESFSARCRDCINTRNHGMLPNQVSRFNRLGFWQTLKYVVKDTWRDVREELSRGRRR